jgi:hypothetical protein
VPGPAPKIDPVRRHARSGPVKLPAEGRKGPTPEWPLEDLSEAESAAWEDLWRTPHAVAWERLGWTRTVARYCRVMVEAEQREAQPPVRSEARQLEDKLGLTPKAMRMLLWEVAADEVGEQRQTASSARSRIKAV